MFYRPGQEYHDLPRNPFNALIVPRPIGWISSLAPDGTANLAPYSFFNGISYTPPQVMFSTGQRPHAKGEPHEPKDSQINPEATGDFVCNMATWDLREAMNMSAEHVPPGVDEFKHAGLTKAPSETVKSPRVAESPIHLECRYLQSVTTKTREGYGANVLIIGEVVGIHIDDAVLTNGFVDMDKVRPIGRLGYMDYVTVDDVWTMLRPD
ncbi:MAG: flavin reductase family protein [Rhodospirillaceae bacterium]|nr:flavin reductase family protein [Rhodospirillaceae bacterium]